MLVLCCVVQQKFDIPPWGPTVGKLEQLQWFGAHNWCGEAAAYGVVE